MQPRRPITTDNPEFGFFREAFYSALIELMGDPDAEATRAQQAEAILLARAAFDRIARELIAGGWVSIPRRAQKFLDSRGGCWVAERIGRRRSIDAVPWLAHAMRECA